MEGEVRPWNVDVSSGGGTHEVISTGSAEAVDRYGRGEREVIRSAPSLAVELAELKNEVRSLTAAIQRLTQELSERHDDTQVRDVADDVAKAEVSALLQDVEGMFPSEIAEELKLSHEQVSAILETLTAEGLAALD